jgi:hypothetical protein
VRNNSQNYSGKNCVNVVVINIASEVFFPPCFLDVRGGPFIVITAVILDAIVDKGVEVNK